MTQNLNDIFANVGDETTIDTTTNAGDSITVEIVNNANNARNNYTLYPENTLEDVFNACKQDLSLGSGNQINFEYNGITYSDPALTVKKIGMVNGAKLLVHPSGMVAAESIN